MTEHQYHPKITPEHLARKAIVYLRQSSPRQVRENQESQRLQYRMADRAGLWVGKRSRPSISTWVPVPPWGPCPGRASSR